MNTRFKSSLTNLCLELPQAADDTVAIYFAHLEAPGDLSAMVGAEMPNLARILTVVVDTTRLPLAENDLAAVVRLASHGVRVVLAGPPARGLPPMVALHDPDFHRAAVAAIYALSPRQSALLVSPDATAAGGLTRRALAWRASWTHPDDGDIGASAPPPAP